MNDAVLDDLKQFVTTALADQSSQLRNEFRSEMGELRSEVSGLRSEVGEFRAEMHGFRSEMDGLQVEVGELRSGMGELQAGMSGFRAEMDGLRAEMGELRTEVHEGFGRLERKVDDLSAYVADALTASNEAHGEQLDNHERRISRLEHKAA